MTQDDMADGRLICLVGFAPLEPAEFVIVGIFQRHHAHGRGRGRSNWRQLSHNITRHGDLLIFAALLRRIH